VEVFIEEDESDAPEMLYYVDVTARKALESRSQRIESPMTGIENIRSLAVSTFGGSNQFNDWNSIANFISGSGSQTLSKEAFYGKLMRTPENQLPQTKHLVTVQFVDKSRIVDGSDTGERVMKVIDQYLICSALGAGKCRAMACNPEHRDLKFLPWASVAAHLIRNGQHAPASRGNAFCFLPLPAETGFNVHLNGYFELSANRRDIWFGDDMSGSGKIRSEWNRLLLWDVISPLYSQLLLEARSLLGPGKYFDRLWPVNISSDIWKIVRSRVYHLAVHLPLVYTMLDSGKWVSLTSAVFLDSPDYDNIAPDDEFRVVTNKTLMSILLQEKISVVSMSTSVISCMKEESCGIIEVSPSMIRECFKRPDEHSSLRNSENVVFLLRYCMDDLVERRLFKQLHGLPLLPLLNGLNGTIADPNSNVCYYVSSEVERDLLTSASFALVDVWTSDSRLNSYMISEDLHSCTNIQALNSSSFVELLTHSFPAEWLGLPEIRWVPRAESSENSPYNPQWLTQLWDYIASDTRNNGGKLSHFEDNLQIVPTVVADGERTLQVLTANMAVVNMANQNTGAEINAEVTRILWSTGIRTLDSSYFRGTNRSRIYQMLQPYIHPPTVRGIITALKNSVSDVQVVARNERMAARFHYLNKSEKIKLRGFIRDSDDIDLQNDEIDTLRSLPIFEVFDSGKKQRFSHLSVDSFLPPSCADLNHLDSRFVKATSRKDVAFLERIGVTTMNPREYYSVYLCSSLAQNLIDEANRTVAVTKLLQDTYTFAEEDGGEALLDRMSIVAFVPNSHGSLVKPTDLYDPQESGLIDLVDDSMLPASELRHTGVLQSLRAMGMKTKLSSDGIIESARKIEYEAKNLSIQEDLVEDKVHAVRKRATALLNFLDDENNIMKFLSEARVENNTIESGNIENGEIELTMNQDLGDMTQELNSICWLPVERSPIGGRSEARPPKRDHQLSAVGISSPNASRPKSDEWICSSSSDILPFPIKSDTLIKLFKWNLPPKTSSVASQLIALAHLYDELQESQTLRQHLASVTSQIYEILNSGIESSNMDEKEQVLILLQDAPWIWVGDNFVRTAQVAFNAPDNAKPFLYNVPNAMECFNTLLQSCGVRESFSGVDFVQLLSSMSHQLNGNPCDSRQLDLVLFVSRYLSRVPSDELDRLNKSDIFLPSRDNIMHRASEMTFDDAPWLSAIVKRTRHVFVHPDVGNEVARILGSKSLRDVLSAHQNGMVKIPVPKHQALQQLIKNRTIDVDEISKIVLELMEIAELKGAKQVSIMLDRRSHSTMSLLHPCLAAAQGAALIVCFHDVAIDVDELVQLTSPVNYYSNTISGSGGSGGSGYPRYGRGFSGSFSITDFLQVLSGRSLALFDPNGSYFIEDTMLHNLDGTSTVRDESRTMSKRKDKASARNYGMSYSFCRQFPDQFEPFLSLPLGVEESMINQTNTNGGPFYRGTIIRMPFRSNDGPPSLICDTCFDEEDFEGLASKLKDVIPQTLLFTYHLQSISVDTWQAGEASFERLLNCRVSSSPLSRRAHLEEMWENKLWKKDKSKLGKLFKNSWNPVKTSHTLQISSRYSDQENDISDTYVVMSVLAPPRLREMACTESLSPLNLLPLISIAAHVDRSIATPQLNTTEYKPAEGSIFVGLPTLIKTGLPFHINAPIFLHEWSGNVLLSQEDDAEFKLAYPGIRNVTIPDKNTVSKVRSLALYVWNRQALTSAMTELIPSIMRELKESIHFFHNKNPRLLYRFWPYYERINESFRVLLDHSVYTELASQDMDIYLTEKDGFKSIVNGCFASPDYDLNEAAAFFLQRMSLFTTPKLVVEDLNRFGINGRQLTPTVARALLKGGRHLRELSGRPREILAILEYCLADLVDKTDFDSSSAAAGIIRKELLGLYIIPLADGTIGQIGKQVIIATAEQQHMLPAIKSKFLWPRATKALEQFLSKPGFVSAMSMESFGPKILSQYVSTVLPRSWEGKDFVQWTENSEDLETGTGPSKNWIYQFWREVHIWDHDAVQLFRRWPLIPTKSGELANCGNARFVLYICSAAISSTLRSSLINHFTELQSAHEKEERCDLLSLATERRLRNNSISAPNSDDDDEFWNMGKNLVDKVLAEDENQEHIPSEGITNEIASVGEASGDEVQDASPHITDTSDVPNIVSESIDDQPNMPLYDHDTASFHLLYRILMSINCPLLEASFFTDEDINKTLPTDRLGMSRAVMCTLNQCINYWSSNIASSESRLHWSELNSHDFDDLLTFLSSHQGTRLSLMVSDLNMIKNLPIFETFSKTFISIADRDQNFTLDNTVDIASIGSYLPLSLQRKLLMDKPQFKELYEDLSIRILDEANVLEKFVLKEFQSMPLTQKEAVVKNILEKWSDLKNSNSLIDILKNTAFVKRKENMGNGEIVFVKPSQLFDPRIDILNVIIDEDRSCFPAEEFATEESLNMLKIVGLQTSVDKDTFLKCAWIVEGEQSVPKALKLFEYFSEHFEDFYDNNRGDFIRNLAEVSCVPAAQGQSIGLYRFRDAAAPKDKHLVFKVMPVIHHDAVPPQVMFSSLGIVSPPPISTVLRQLRTLTQSQSTVDHWSYKHGTVEAVFAEIFAFLQDNYAELSPRVQEGLQLKPIVPVGTTLVRPNRLFFRLSKDLAPFFYEVPRAFGAYDVLLRNLGVRESPKSGDYALSLTELNREIGTARLNANELKSVVEVVHLVASNDDTTAQDAVFAPDLRGKLVNINLLLQNDRPWLVNSRRLDMNRIHLAHPKLSKEICDRLHIRALSHQVQEVLDKAMEVKEIIHHRESLARVGHTLHSDNFISIFLGLVPKYFNHSNLKEVIKKFTLVKVESIHTRFILSQNNLNSAIDVTNQANSAASLCFIEKELIIISSLPLGVSNELALATGLCDYFSVSRQHVAGIAALLSSHTIDDITAVKERMGLYEDGTNDELTRGDPGRPLVPTDAEAAILKPLKSFTKGEIVGVRESSDSNQLIYGVVTECEESSSSLSRLRISIGNGTEKSFLTSEVYSLGRSTSEDDSTSHQVPADQFDISAYEGSLLQPIGGNNNDLEAALAPSTDNSKKTPISRKDILTAVQDLLQSADLSLNHDAKNMLDSNLALQEALSEKKKQLNDREKNTQEMAKIAMSGTDAFLCPITRETMEDPVICCDGHTYERHAIEMWLSNNSRSPKTNQPLASTEVVPNHALRSSIEAISQLRESIKRMAPDTNWEE